MTTSANKSKLRTTRADIIQRARDLAAEAGAGSLEVPLGERGSLLRLRDGQALEDERRTLVVRRRGRGAAQERQGQDGA